MVDFIHIIIMQEDQRVCDPVYEDQFFTANLFFQISENRQLLIGKITLTPKHTLPSFPMSIHIKGLYKVSSHSVSTYREDSLTDLTHNNHDYQDTLHSIDLEETKRVEKKQMLAESIDPDAYDQSEYFLEGKQQVTQIGATEQFQAWKSVVFPFNFSLPPNLPPTLDNIFFAGKQIGIKYFILAESKPQNGKKPHRIFFLIKIAQNQTVQKKSSQLCRSIKYRCFKKFFCGCLGIYHLQIVGTLISVGQVQIQARIYKDNKRGQEFVDKLIVVLQSELTNVKKVSLDSKEIFLKQNQFQMLSGEVLLTYDPKLQTHSNSLFQIRFWIDLKIQFSDKVWAYVLNDTNTDLKL